MAREIHDIYDAILKIIIIVYNVTFLNYIGIDKKIKKILKTEFVTVNGKKYYLDFLCQLEDNTLCHIEFQFPKAQPNDLDRFFNYNIIAEVRHGHLTETTILNFTSKKIKDTIRHIGKSKCFKPKQVYLSDIDFKSYWRNINMKAEQNVKLTGFEEITLLLTCLMPECKNKAKMLYRISKLLKNENLFDKSKFEYIQAIISLETENLISHDEQVKILGEINMSPQAQQTITEVIKEVNKKSLYKERLSGIDEGIEIGKKEGKLEGKIEGKKEGIEEVARNLKGIMSDEEISKRTGLTVNRIKEL